MSRPSRISFPRSGGELVDMSMRVLTLKEPRATLIVAHGRSTESRSTNVAGNYRGPVAVHTALRALPVGDPAWHIAAAAGLSIDRREYRLGCIIGVVDLVDVTSGAVHFDDRAVSSHRSRTSIGSLLLHFENPHALEKPMRYAGSFALLRLDINTATQIIGQLRDAGEPPRAPA